MLSAFIAALAMTAAPAPQTAPRAAAGPVTVEVVATAHIDAPATAFTLTTTLSVEGKDRAAADAALAAKRAEVAAALAGAGVPASAIGPAPEMPNPFLGTVKLDTTTVTEMPAIDMDELMTEDGEESSGKETGDAAAVAESQVMITESLAIRTTSIAQATAAKAALEKLELTVGDPRVSLANADAVHREAKKKAIAKARADADAYAAALGLRVVRVARVSEAGGSLLLPQLQGTVMGVLEIFETGQEIPRGSLRISETVTVEFVVAP